MTTHMVSVSRIGYTNACVDRSRRTTTWQQPEAREKKHTDMNVYIAKSLYTLDVVVACRIYPFGCNSFARRYTKILNVHHGHFGLMHRTVGDLLSPSLPFSFSLSIGVLQSALSRMRIWSASLFIRFGYGYFCRVCAAYPKKYWNGIYRFSATR